MSETTTLYIDNMVCNRCKTAVRQVLTNLGWRIERMELGRVGAIPPAGDTHEGLLQSQLETLGFRLRDPVPGPVSRIKGLIIEHVYDDPSDPALSIADLITADIGLSYSYLSRLFSGAEGRTISDYYQAQRMERAKHLLVTTHDQVSAIAGYLNFGSAARFSAAFRRATGMAPTAFRERGQFVARPLDEL
ncbi:MAG: AraC family transcriptional regulator [Lewinella sp.]